MRVRALLYALPLLLAILTPIHVAHGERYSLTLVGVKPLPLPNNTRIACILPLASDQLLLAGYTGAPPRAFAAIYDLNQSSLEPVPVQGLEGSLRSEIVGCEPGPGTPILYGYVQTDNQTFQTMLWAYLGGVLQAYPLRSKNGGPVLGVPYFMREYSGVTYITAFLGDCEARGTMSIAYALVGGIQKILQGDFQGYALILAFNVTRNGIYQRVAGKWYRCVYLTGAYQLATGDVVILGYALNQSTVTGFRLAYDALLQVRRESFKQLPFIPLAFTTSGTMGVAIGPGLRDPQTPIVMTIALDGSTRYAQITYQGFDNVYLYKLACMANTCVASGYAERNGRKIGLIALIGINTTLGGVNYADLYKWETVSTVTSVTLTPKGVIYATGVTPGGENLLVIARLTTGESQVVERTPPSTPGSLVMLGSVAAFLAVLVALLTLLARRKATR